jgi:hypothetical protein
MQIVYNTTQLSDIESILYEAHAYGLRDEVLDSAHQLLQNNMIYDIVDAYHMAYYLIIGKYEECSTSN